MRNYKNKVLLINLVELLISYMKDLNYSAGRQSAQYSFKEERGKIYLSEGENGWYQVDLGERNNEIVLSFSSAKSITYIKPFTWQRKGSIFL